jgi:hypothetical protein
MGLQAGADALGGPLDLDGAGDHPAQIAQAIPALCQSIVAPGFRQGRKDAQMHALLRPMPPGPPGLLGREAADGREPGRQAGEEAVQHRPAGAPARRIGPVAIEGILAQVEIECRQIDRAEVMQRREVAV